MTPRRKKRLALVLALILGLGATITKFAKPSMSTDMLWPLLIGIVGFACFFGAVTMIRLRNEILIRESHRPWVRELVK